METRLLGPEAVEAAADYAAVVAAVEDAFAADARGDAQMPAKSYVDLPQYNGDFRSMPAYLDAQSGDDEGWDAAAVKWVNVHPDNPGEHDLPTVIGAVIYSDPMTVGRSCSPGLSGWTLTHLTAAASHPPPSPSPSPSPPRASR